MDRLVLKNICINLVGLVLPTFVSLVTVPAYIRLLGVDRYGVISLVWALIGYFSVLDLGMSLATENQIAKARANQDGRISEVFWSAFWLNLATGVVGGVVIYFGSYFYTTAVLHLEPQFEREVLSSLPWLALAIPVANVAWVFAGAITAVERFRIFNINQTLGIFLFQLLPLGCAYAIAPTLSVVLPAAVCARIVGAIALGASTIHALGIKKIEPPRRAVVAGLFGYGRWAVLLSGVGMVSDTLDRVLVGSLLGARFVTFYTVPQNLVTRMNLLPDAMMRTLFPRLSSLGGAQADQMARNALAFLNGVFTPCVVCALFLLGPFLSLWISPAFAAQSVTVGRILIIGVWLGGQSSLLKILMLAQAGQASVAKLGVVIAPVFLLVLWFGISHFGVLGASVVVALKSLLEYGLLIGFARIRARPVLADMSAHFALIVAALAVAQWTTSLAGMGAATLALVAASLGWSLCSSSRLRDIARHPLRVLFASSGEPHKEATSD